MKQKFIYLRDIFKGHSSLWLGLVIASGFTGLDGIISPAVMGILTNILTNCTTSNESAKGTFWWGTGKIIEP